jgi:hypothetical protein
MLSVAILFQIGGGHRRGPEKCPMLQLALMLILNGSSHRALVFIAARIVEIITAADWVSSDFYTGYTYRKSDECIMVPGKVAGT